MKLFQMISDEYGKTNDIWSSWITSENDKPRYRLRFSGLKWVYDFIKSGQTLFWLFIPKIFEIFENENTQKLKVEFE